MRVLHVVPWVSEGNPFGGPVTVAMALKAELASRGNVVDLIAGGTAGGAFADELHIRRVRTFRTFTISRRLGFSGRLSPTLLWHMLRAARRYDIIHVHVCRDLVSLPSAYIAELLGVPVALQPHGMVDPSDRRLAKAWDRFLTRRVFRRASKVFALTDQERVDISRATGRPVGSIDIVRNGIAHADTAPEPRGQPPEMLFCSRLHSRKRPELFVAAATGLLHEGVDGRFALVGPDEGEGASIAAAVSAAGSARLYTESAIEPSAVRNRLAQSAALVLPSVDEPFPMIVLEAMSIGRPVVVSDSCGLADIVRENACGFVVRSDDETDLRDAMRSLIADASLRRSMGTTAQQTVRRELSIEAVGDRVISLYKETGSPR